MTHWWRAYDDAIDNPKLLKLSDATFRAWFTLQCIASANGGALPPADDIAVRLRIKKTKVAQWITELVHARLMDNVNGVFRPHNWDDRQFQSDSSTPRVKRFREKKRNVSSTVSGNVSETASETAPEQSRADTEQSRADAGAAVDEDLKRRAAAIGAAVSALFLGRQLPVPNLSRCERWLADGYGQGTILAAVEAVLKRGSKPSTLEYFDGAIKDRHLAEAPVREIADRMADWFLVIEGTIEETCWQQYTRETTGRPMFICDQIHDGRTVRGIKKPTLFPPGFNDFGERIEASSEEHAA